MILIIVILSVFLGTPFIYWFFQYQTNKLKEGTKRLEYQKELLMLEIEKERLLLKRLEAESKKYDRLIDET